MARPVWSGALTFGLVSLPVSLYTATDSHTIRFHQLQRGTSDRVRNKRINERTGEDVLPDEIVKGYDAGTEYVLIEPGELDDIAPGRSKALDISGFVELEEIEPVFFDRTYYLGPKGKDYTKVYALLEKAMARAGKAAVATFVMRNREYLVVVKAEDGILTLHTLHWADEVRDPRAVVDGLPEETEVTDRELRTAEQLIDTLSKDWDPKEFHDTFQERVARLVEAKRKGEAVEKAPSPAGPTNVVNLMDALRASVDRAKDTKDSTGSEGRGGRGQSGRAKSERSSASDRSSAQRRRSSGRSSASKKSSASAELDDLTRAELYRRATDAGIEGRSTMNRRELIEALSGDGGHRAAS